MLSWKLWGLLRDIPTSKRLRSVLAPKSEKSSFSSRLLVLAAFGFCTITRLPLLLIPVGIHFLCLRTGVNITNTMTRLHELGQYNVCAVTPFGAFGMVLEISRVYIAKIRISGQNMRPLLKAGGIALLLGSLAIFVWVFFAPTPQNLRIAHVLLLLLTLIALVFALVGEYAQSMILSIIIAILAGTTGERNTARLWTIGSYVGIQLALYLSLGFLLNFWFFFFTNILVVSINVQISLAILIAIGCYFGARELIIYLLWNRLHVCINDDVPTFKLLRQR
jgi:hypothetical protein